MKAMLVTAMLALGTTAHAQVRPAYMVDLEPRVITYTADRSPTADAILTATIVGGASAVLWASVLYNDDGYWTRGESAAIGFGVGFVSGLVFWAVNDKRGDG